MSPPTSCPLPLSAREVMAASTLQYLSTRAQAEREVTAHCSAGQGRAGERAHFCLLYVLRSRTATTPSPELTITLPEGRSSSAEMPKLYLSFWGPKVLKRQVLMLTVRTSPVVVPQYITLSSSAT